jgi:hypothetical protein
MEAKMAQLMSAPVNRPEKTSMFSNKQIQNVADGGRERVEAWVRTIANERKVSFHQTPTRRFARAVSRLSDAETDLDQIEELLITLRRVHVINSYQRGLLLVHYRR